MLVRHHLLSLLNDSQSIRHGFNFGLTPNVVGSNPTAAARLPSALVIMSEGISVNQLLTLKDCNRLRVVRFRSYPATIFCPVGILDVHRSSKPT